MCIFSKSSTRTIEMLSQRFKKLKSRVYREQYIIYYLADTSEGISSGVKTDRFYVQHM
jgi:hypothetical protein